MGWGTRAPVVGWKLERERGVKSGVARLGPSLASCHVVLGDTVRIMDMLYCRQTATMVNPRLG